MGAGAVGGYIGARLHRGGHDVLFVARGKHLEALLRDGLRLDAGGDRLRLVVRASDRPEPADLVLFCVKSYDTERAAAQLPEGARVLSLQNGLGNVEKLRARFLGALTGIAYVSAEVVEPGRIVHTAGGSVVVESRAADLKAAFEGSGISCEVSEDITRDVWEKLAANAVFNSIATAWACEIGDLLEPEHRPRAERAFDELYAVARALGIGIRAEARERAFAWARAHPVFRTSTQQDALRGKPLEADALNGELVRLARQAGVPVPTHEEIYGRLKRASGPLGKVGE